MQVVQAVILVAMDLTGKTVPMGKTVSLPKSVASPVIQTESLARCIRTRETRTRSAAQVRGSGFGNENSPKSMLMEKDVVRSSCSLT